MNKERVRILILVKTYPTLSKKYLEIVCTAGIKSDGSWIRIYPVPFRLLEYKKRYKKYQWMDVEIIKNTSDPRPESYYISDINSLQLGDEIGTRNGWQERKDLILGKVKIYEEIDALIEKANTKNELSLAMFKPNKIDAFTFVEEKEKEWPEDIIKKIIYNTQQSDLFSTEEERQIKDTFRLVKKLPYKFSYRLSDSKGKNSTLLVEDWELGQLFWNCLKKSGGDGKEAAIKVQQKYYDEFLSKDIYFYLGTTRQFHGWAKNPFVITGVFYPPKTKSQQL